MIEFEVPLARGICPVRAFGQIEDRTRPIVLFFMDGFGPRPALFDMAEQLSSEGYRVLLPLHRELGIPVLLSTLVGEEVLAVMSLKDRAGHDAGMEVGERLPLVAPIGAPFLAWSTDKEVEEWINRRSTPLSNDLREPLLRDLKLTRERGYQVALRPPEQQTIGSLMAEMATSSHIVDYKMEVSKLIHEFNSEMCQPVTLEEDAFYDVMLIAAPIFDQEGAAAFNLSLGGFPQHLSGGQLIKYAERLSRTCLEIMRSDRSQARRQAQG